MKIAHISLPWNALPPNNYGGTEVMLYNLIVEQMRQGHEVTVFAPGDSRTCAELVSFIPRSLSAEEVPWEAHLKAYYHHFKAVEYIRERQFDIVHTHLATTTEMYLFPLTDSLHVPHVMTLHCPFPFDRCKEWRGDADMYYMEWIHKVPLVCISESARRQLTGPFSVIGVVYHGLDQSVFRPPAVELGNYFAWLGRIIPEKGPHLAIQAARQARVPLVLAGVVDRHSQRAVDYFDTMIRPQLDGKDISYVGPVNTDQKIRFLSQARGLLNPIEWEEPFGIVMIEAMAVGCPVIAFARGSAPEIVCNQKSGFLVQDVLEMVDAIKSVGQIRRDDVVAHFEEHFSSRVMARNYTDIYDRVIGGM